MKLKALKSLGFRHPESGEPEGINKGQVFEHPDEADAQKMIAANLAEAVDDSTGESRKRGPGRPAKEKD